MSNKEKEVLKILKGINSNITDDLQLDLLSNGVIDSFDVANIVAALEAHFKIEVEAEDIVPENFSTVESIIKLVDDYKNLESSNVNDQYIPINKGNYSMDTQEREKMFDKYRGYGWEEEYRKYRENWERCGKNKVILEYPLLIDIELSTVCNLHCPMCYTITEDFSKHVYKGFMEFSLFKKIIDEIKGKVPAIRLSLRGEPTLHPDFIKCIHYAKQAGIKEISTLTNGSTLNIDFFEKILLAGLDWMTISLDGLKEEYEKIRKPLKFEDTFNKIVAIKNLKEKYCVHRPVIKIQGIWPSLKENVEEFYNTFEPYVDLVAFNPLIDYLDKDNEIIYESNFSCPQLYQRLVIGVDGKVMPCSNDEMNSMCIGDVREKTIYDIWHGEEISGLRKMHGVYNGFLKCELCKLCYLPRKTEDNEIAKVNGREFIIKNYVGRVQEIGK